MGNKNLCEGCSLCCKYIAIEIDKPENKEDIDQIRWFLLHKNVWVFIDHDNSWNVQFNTPCTKLSSKGLCTIYRKRPRICKDYSTESCEKWGEGKSFKVLWKNAEEFEKWLKNKRNFP
ncbi:YkgJ family cysteine cluster protein [Candidatus Pacearchaeota archaeon]|nr:MAG: YkgJ family cysteine cluster protein [Candidatus Pacearchaeota archaeon]